MLAPGPGLGAEGDCPNPALSGGEQGYQRRMGVSGEDSLAPEGPRRGPRKKYADPRFQQFRREVREIGVELRENVRLIGELESELAGLETGPEAEAVSGRLEDLRRRQAELRLELARKKAIFSLRALENAEIRHQAAMEDLERVRGIVERDYPDLADFPPVR